MREKSLRRIASALLTGAKSFVLTILGLSVMAAAAWGQLDTGGSVNVTVTDPSGAGVPAAALSLKDTSTNVIRKAVTQQTGTYTFQSLPYGNYELTVTKDGFDSALFQAIQVETARVTSIAAKLKVGTTQQTVTISGESPLVETQSNVLSDTIDTNQVVNLPLSGRAMFPLAFLVPGWTSTSPGSSAGTWDNMPGGAIVSADFDGTQAMSNRFRSGGFTYGTSVVSPRIEDIAEMTIQTAQLDLSGNGTASMKISLVTRRGANAFHGRLFEDFRNTDLNANSWSNDARGVPRAIINLNDFGGAIGGPILKNKLFFYGTFANSRQPGTTDTSNSVLSASAQQGIFQYKAANGSIQSTNVLAIGASGGGSGTVNSNIAGQFTAINGVLNQGYLTPTSDPNISTLTWAYASPVIDYYPAFRFDYNASDKLRFNVSYSQTKTSNPKTNAPNFPGGIDPVDYTSNRGNNKIAGFGVDYTIRPTLINQFHAGYLYQYSLFDSENLGINLATIFPQTWAYGASLYGGPYPRTAISSLYPMFSWTDSLNWQHGNHSVVFGGGWFHEQDHYWNGPGGEPATTLGIASNDPILSTFVSALTSAGLNTSQQSSAEGLYATLSGRVSSVNIDVGRPLDPKTGQYALFGNYNLDEAMQAGNMFVQDRWRIKPNLTLSYGLRWDIVGDDHDINGGYSSPATIADFWGPTPVGAVDQPGNLGGLQNPTFQAKVHSYNTSWKNPQPAIALAWQPETSGFLGKLLPHDKTVIRTGWSLRNYQEGAQNFWAYASNSGAFFYQSGSLTAATGGAVGTFNPGTLTLGQPLPAYSLFPATYSTTLPESTLTFSGNSFYAMNPNIRQPYVEQWNFGIQRQIGSGSALEVRYVGNEAQHVWFSENLNEVDVTNNGFLQEFQNAANNLAINQSHGNGNSFANLGLAGQVPLPIFAAEFGGVTTGSLYTQFTTNLETGAVGNVANTLSKNETYICNMFGAKFSPCVLHGLGGAGTSYPLNFWDVNPYTSGSSLNYLDASGHSNYHSLQVELRQRTWHGMEFTANYTLAHSLVLGPVNAYQANAAGSYQTIRDFRLSYRPSTYDIRNTFKLFGTYNLPFGKGRAYLHSSKLADEIVGGWNIGTILTFQSGPPTQITGGYDTFNANDGGVTFAPGVTAKTIQDNVGVYRTGNPWVDTINPKLLAPNNGVNASLTYAPNTTAGIFGANPYIYGPHWFNDDMSLNKAIPIRENVRGSLQFQFLNVFNHPTFGLGTLAAQSLAFAETTTTLGNGALYRRIEIRANIEF